MHAGARQPEHGVARRHPARQQGAALGRTHREAGQVVVAGGIHAGHLGRLAADQRAAGEPAALGDAADHGRRLLHLQPAGGEIIEEEQRLGALHHQIVDAHGDQVDADGVVLPGLDRDPQLGADAVRGRHQHRVGEAGGLEVEQGAEAAQPAHHACPGGGAAPAA